MSRCNFDVLAGLPIGVRMQVPLLAGDHAALLAEATGGIYLILPVAGLGLRCQCAVLNTECNRLTIGPGVSIFGMYNTLHADRGWFGGGPTGWMLAAADVDIAWHRSTEVGGGVVGLKLDAAQRDNGGRGTTRAMMLPWIGIFAGWRF